MLPTSGNANTSHSAISGEKRRNELIILAFSIIAEKGFEGLRVRDVASRAEINIATLHYYFPGKEDLVHAVVQYLTTQFATVRDPQNSSENGQSDNPLAMLRQEFADLQYRLEQLPQLFIVAAELELRALRDPSITPILSEMYQAWHNHLAGILQKGVTAKVFRADLDIPITTTAIMTLIKGLSYQPNSEPTNQFSRLAAQVERWLTA